MLRYPYEARMHLLVNTYKRLSIDYVIVHKYENKTIHLDAWGNWLQVEPGDIVDKNVSYREALARVLARLASSLGVECQCH